MMNVLDIYNFDIQKEEDEIIVKNSNMRETGVLGLDMMLGGGFLKNSIVEISGTERSGKSTLAWHAVASAQKRGELVLIVSAKSGEIQDWLLHSCGIDLSKVIVITANEYDEAIDAAAELMDEVDIDLLVLDNLGRSAVFTGKPRLTKKRMQLLASKTRRNDTTTILIVDTSMKWLEAHPFWINQHINSKYRGDGLLSVRVVRATTGYPGAVVDIPVREVGGVDICKHILFLAAELGFIEEVNSRYYYNTIYLGHGPKQASTNLSNIEGAIEELYGKIKETDPNALFRNT